MMSSHAEALEDEDHDEASGMTATKVEEEKWLRRYDSKP